MIFVSTIFKDFKSKLSNIPADQKFILHINDTFDEVFFQEICDLAQRFPDVVINDHMSMDNIVPASLHKVSLPLFAAGNARKFREVQTTDIVTTNHSFNFMINKKTINRYLCIRMIEILGLTDYTYTWSGAGREQDLTKIIQELESLRHDPPITAEQRGLLLAPIGIEPRFFFPPEIDIVPVEFFIDIHQIGGQFEAWTMGLKDVFNQSAVALITESIEYQQESAFTEKTLYSVLGLNFPIWVGGFEQPKRWQQMGFDIFDDVINHDYQNRDTLFERCWYAIKDNIEILRDRDLAASLRCQHRDRLLANRDRLFNDHLVTYSLDQIAHFDSDIKHSVMKVMKILGCAP